MEMIRCPACRGAKKVPKLGGVIGECNTCEGEGKIKLSDKPVMKTVEPTIAVDLLVNSVANCVPTTDKVNVEPPPVIEEKKIDPKKAIYRKKKA